jgi:hypothetical protein
VVKFGDFFKLFFGAFSSVRKHGICIRTFFLQNIFRKLPQKKIPPPHTLLLLLLLLLLWLLQAFLCPGARINGE